MRTPWPLLALLALPGCPEEGTQAPRPPDTTALQARLSNPTARMSASAGAEILAALPGRLVELTDVVGLLVLGTGALDALFSGEGTETTENALRPAAHPTRVGLAQRRHALSVEAGGWVVLERRCPGWGEAEGRGQITLTAVSTSQGGIAETIWGRARRCLTTAGDRRLRYDATITLRLPELDAERLQLQITGQVQADAERRRFDLAARLAGDRLYVPQPLAAGGNLLLGLDFTRLAATTAGAAPTVDDLLQGLVIEDADGEWTCDAAGCAGPGGRVSW